MCIRDSLYLLRPFPSPPLPLPSPPLEVGPPKIQIGFLGSAVSSPSGAWSGAEPQLKSNLVHFSLEKMRSGGNDFNYFKLTKLANFVQFKRMLMFCLEDWGPGPPGLPLATKLFDCDVCVCISVRPK